MVRDRSGMKSEFGQQQWHRRAEKEVSNMPRKERDRRKGYLQPERQAEEKTKFERRFPKISSFFPSSFPLRLTDPAGHHRKPHPPARRLPTRKRDSRREN